jgi:hypothetical protein
MIATTSITVAHRVVVVQNISPVLTFSTSTTLPKSHPFPLLSSKHIRAVIASRFPFCPSLPHHPNNSQKVVLLCISRSYPASPRLQLSSFAKVVLSSQTWQLATTVVINLPAPVPQLRRCWRALCFAMAAPVGVTEIVLLYLG